MRGEREEGLPGFRLAQPGGWRCCSLRQLTSEKNGVRRWAGVTAALVESAVGAGWRPGGPNWNAAWDHPDGSQRKFPGGRRPRPHVTSKSDVTSV